MSRVGAVIEGYLHAPDPGAFVRLTRTYANWPQVSLARVGLGRYPVQVRRRLGDTFPVQKHGDVDLFAHPEAEWIPGGARLRLFGRTLEFETDATGALCDTYFREHYRALPVAGATVLDLGALDGDTAVYFRLRGARHVVAVEVDPAAVRRLTANLARNGVGGITIVADRARRIEPYLAAIDRSVPPDDRASLVLKMDIEGDEEPLLEESDAEALHRFPHLVLEYHHGPERCARRLSSLGYALRVDPPLRHPNGDLCGLIWADRPASPAAASQ